MKNRWARRWIPVLTSLLFLGVVVFALVSPQSRPNYWLFRCAYSAPIARHIVLERYRSNLWNFGAGYTPNAVDQFLCARLETNAPQSEIDAIAYFYARQASGREGQRIISISDAAKQKVIAAVLRNLDDYNLWQVGPALLLVEELRCGKEIWKGGFGPNNAKESANWSVWWQKRGASEVKNRYRSWWKSTDSWAQKKGRNPLAGSDIEANGP